MVHYVFLFALVAALLTACAERNSQLPTVAPEIAPTRDATPTRPAPTPVEVIAEAPRLLNPTNGEQLHIRDGVRLAWVWERNLQPGEYFEILIARPGGNLERALLAQSTVRNATDWFLAQRPGQFEWTVRVIKERQGGAAERLISYSAEKFTLEVVGMEPDPNAPSPTPNVAG